MGRGNQKNEGTVMSEGWITKIDSNGEKVWEKQFRYGDQTDYHGPVYAICESK